MFTHYFYGWPSPEDIAYVDCLGTSGCYCHFLSNLDGSVWLVLYHNRRGSASVDVLAGAKRSCGVRNSGGKLDWYSSTGM